MRIPATFAIVAFSISTLFAQAETLSLPPGPIAARAVERRAVEAMIWGMPAVNYDLMRQEMLDTTLPRSIRWSIGAGRWTG